MHGSLHESPGHRRLWLDITGGRLTKQRSVVLWRKSVCWTNDAYVALGESIAFFHGANYIERRTLLDRGCFRWKRTIANGAETSPYQFRSIDKFPQLRRLDGERRIQSAFGARNRKMLFDNNGAKRRGGICDIGAKRMIRQTDFASIALAHIGDGQDVRFGLRRRVGTCTLERYEPIAAVRPKRGNGVVQFFKARHARRQQDRFAGPCNCLDQRNVDQLERSDLDGIDFKRQQEFHGSDITRGTGTRQPFGASGFKDRMMPAP